MKWVTNHQGFSEVFTSDGLPRPHYEPLVSSIESFTRSEIDRRERLQTLALISQGVTFTVYGEKEGLERIFPFDFVPRIIPAAEWKTIQDGLVQRITALNLFLLDIYQTQNCLRDGVIPAELVLSRREFKRQLLGIVPPRKIFTHVVTSSAGSSPSCSHRIRCVRSTITRRSCWRLSASSLHEPARARRS